MVLCDNFNDVESSISLDLDCYFLYSMGDNYYKIAYEGKTETLREYKFFPELNGTFRLIKTIKNQGKKYILSLLKTWRQNNKKSISLLTKSEVKLFSHRNKLTESNSCWKTPKQLRKAIEGGLEVPNCIPDKNYDLNENQIFINRKNRELMGKYKKAKDWFDEIIADGDKDYAEKVMQIIEKWKRNYEDKIRTAKGVLKEEEDYNIIFDEQEINDYLNRCDKSYNFYKNKIEKDFMSPHKEMYLDRLNTWYSTTKTYLEQKKEEVLSSKGNMPIEITYTPFGFLDLYESIVIVDIQKVLSENTIVQQKIRNIIDHEKKIKQALAKFKEDSNYDNLPTQEKEDLMKNFYDDFVSVKKKLTEEFISTDGDDYFDRDTDASFYNDILRKQLYMFWAKGYWGTVMYMTPDTYYDKCARMQRTTREDQIYYVDKDVAQKYMEKMLDGEKFPMPYIDFSAKRQEGRHRSYAIKMINPDIKIPVLCVYDRQQDRKMILQAVEEGDTYEEFVQLCKHVNVPYDEKTYNAIKNKTL